MGVDERFHCILKLQQDYATIMQAVTWFVYFSVSELVIVIFLLLRNKTKIWSFGDFMTQKNYYIGVKAGEGLSDISLTDTIILVIVYNQVLCQLFNNVYIENSQSVNLKLFIKNILVSVIMFEAISICQILFANIWQSRYEIPSDNMFVHFGQKEMLEYEPDLQPAIKIDLNKIQTYTFGFVLDVDESSFYQVYSSVKGTQGDLKNIWQSNPKNVNKDIFLQLYQYNFIVNNLYLNDINLTIKEDGVTTNEFNNKIENESISSNIDNVIRPVDFTEDNLKTFFESESTGEKKAPPPEPESSEVTTMIKNKHLISHEEFQAQRTLANSPMQQMKNNISNPSDQLRMKSMELMNNYTQDLGKIHEYQRNCSSSDCINKQFQNNHQSPNLNNQEFRFKSKQYGDPPAPIRVGIKPDDPLQILKNKDLVGPFTPESELWTNLESRSQKIETIPNIDYSILVNDRQFQTYWIQKIAKLMITVVLITDVVKNILISSNMIGIALNLKKQSYSVLNVVEKLDPKEPRLVSTKIILTWDIYKLIYYYDQYQAPKHYIASKTLFFNPHSAFSPTDDFSNINLEKVTNQYESIQEDDIGSSVDEIRRNVVNTHKDQLERPEEWDQIKK